MLFNFSFISAHFASLIKIWPLLRGGVCISLVGTGPPFFLFRCIPPLHIRSYFSVIYIYIYKYCYFFFIPVKYTLLFLVIFPLYFWLYLHVSNPSPLHAVAQPVHPPPFRYRAKGSLSLRGKRLRPLMPFQKRPWTE